MSKYVENMYDKIMSTYHPTSVKGLLESAHCKILYADLDSATGGCTQSNSRCHTIIVNDNWDKSYQDFVMLHEFSHIKLHNGSSTPFFRSVGLNKFISQMENEANELAMQLLISFQDEDLIGLCTSEQLMKCLGLPTELQRFI